MCEGALPAIARDEHSDLNGAQSRPEWAILMGVAAAVALLHMLTNGRYGFHRDELQFLSDARHLDWGFVAYPPLTPFLERVGLGLFGVSMVGLRLFSVLAQAAAIVVTGLMARELGGGRLAQVTAALAVALSPLPLFNGYGVPIHVLRFPVVGADRVLHDPPAEDGESALVAGDRRGRGRRAADQVLDRVFHRRDSGRMSCSRPRADISRAAGSGPASHWRLLIFLPNFLWLVRHDFISYHFLQHIHVRDVGEGRADGFLIDQFLICANLFAAPLWLAGLIAFLRDRRYRMLAWMYLIPLALFFFGKGRGYYMAAAYPMLLAMGAARANAGLHPFLRGAGAAVEAIFFAGLALFGVFVCALILPLAVKRAAERVCAREQRRPARGIRLGPRWSRPSRAIRDSLPAEQRAHLGIADGNYGEQGPSKCSARAYHLPPPISTTNSVWLRGYPTPPPTTLIVLGYCAREGRTRLHRLPPGRT